MRAGNSGGQSRGKDPRADAGHRDHAERHEPPADVAADHAGRRARCRRAAGVCSARLTSACSRRPYESVQAAAVGVTLCHAPGSRAGKHGILRLRPRAGVRAVHRVHGLHLQRDDLSHVRSLSLAYEKDGGMVRGTHRACEDWRQTHAYPSLPIASASPGRLGLVPVIHCGDSPATLPVTTNSRTTMSGLPRAGPLAHVSMEARQVGANRGLKPLSYGSKVPLEEARYWCYQDDQAPDTRNHCRPSVESMTQTVTNATGRTEPRQAGPVPADGASPRRRTSPGRPRHADRIRVRRTARAAWHAYADRVHVPPGSPADHDSKLFMRKVF